jgi:predicted transposase/invertase (TIGR01784 family)
VKTDPIFYRLFQTFPSVFFELIGRPQEEATAYEFRSVEIKQTAFRIDGVFIPVSSSAQQPILFVEVQFQKDPDFYFRLFSEITLYLRQYKPISDWQAVVIYPARSIETPEPLAYQDWLSMPKIRRLYLDELEVEGEPSLGVSMAQLVVESEDRTTAKARGLMAKVQQDIRDRTTQRKILELIETIVVYKFPRKSRQELEAMLGLGDLKETRFYQEAKQEGEQKGEQKAKVESVPRLLQMGLTLEQISQGLNLPLEAVRQAAQSQYPKD